MQHVDSTKMFIYFLFSLFLHCNFASTLDVLVGKVVSKSTQRDSEKFAKIINEKDMLNGVHLRVSMYQV